MRGEIVEIEQPIDHKWTDDDIIEMVYTHGVDENTLLDWMSEVGWDHEWIPGQGNLWMPPPHFTIPFFYVEEGGAR